MKNLSKKQKNSLIVWLALGFILRIILMPITAHRDLFSGYLRSSKIFFDGSTPYSIFNSVGHIIQSAWLIIVKPLMPTFNTFLGHTANSMEGHPEIWTSMMNDSFVNWYLFLLKFPYLLFEVGIIFMIFLIFKDNIKDKLFYTKLWILNIPFIYAVYIFGRYETITVFFLLLFIYLIKEKKIYLALIPLGLLSCTRMFFLIFIPFYGIYLLKQHKKYLLPILLTGIPLGLIAAFIFQNKILPILNSRFALFFFSFILNGIYIPLYPIFYILIIYLQIKNKIDLTKSIALATLGFAMICYWHPQYFVWSTPFILYLILKNKDILYAWLGIIVFYIIALFTWRADTTVKIFSPINYELFNSIVFPSYLVYVGIFAKGVVGILIAYLIIKHTKLYKIKTIKNLLK